MGVLCFEVGVVVVVGLVVVFVGGVVVVRVRVVVLECYFVLLR